MIELKNIRKTYRAGDYTTQAIDDVSLAFRPSEFVAVVGESGSGKTTLLNIIGGLLSYDEGEMLVRDRSTQSFKKTDWDAYRNNSVGFIFQNYQLIPHLSVLSNVEMGLTLSGIDKKTRHERASELLDRVGLKEHMNKKPNQLSGGQMQRVAIARALANDPDIILADEPTGALDSETSEEIMSLLTEISKDKLILMVTHSREQAERYATRIVELKDGQVVKDTNPYQAQTLDTDYQLNKTGMSFWNALKLSGQNIMTKKGRTLITALAASIGIFGVAVILALSNGLNNQIANFERDSLASYPLEIQSETVSVEAMMSMGEASGEDREEYPEEQMLLPKTFIEDMEDMEVNNAITDDYLDYLEDIPSEYIQAINYDYPAALNLLTEFGDEIEAVDASTGGLQVLPGKDENGELDFVKSKYDLLEGDWPIDESGLLLVVDAYNQIDTTVLDSIGIDYSNDQGIDFNAILNKEYQLVYQDDFYKKEGDFYKSPQSQADYEEIYGEANNLDLSIAGVIRPKEDSNIEVRLGGLMYSNQLKVEFINKAQESNIVQDQRETDYHLLTGQAFASDEEEAASEDFQAPTQMEPPAEGAPSATGAAIEVTTPSEAYAMTQANMTKEEWLSYLGDESRPSYIAIYPSTFDNKAEIVNYLEAWNEDAAEEDQVIVTDMAALITDLSGGLMSAITIALVSFASISLVVSMIMIGIIIYVSVLERTGEIGILRALGAREKDISRVFNAETFIIGLSSGLLGILFAYLLTIPINYIIYQVAEIENVAQLHPAHVGALLAISVVLTLIGGIIPARIAAKKDPVLALSGQ